MNPVEILLLRPVGDQPSPVDQSLGARLAAADNVLRETVVLQQDSFQDGDLSDLEKRLEPWAGKVRGVVGATGVSESNKLGRLAEQWGLLCFVANNNPSVWEGRSHIFHIGVPTSLTTQAVAENLVQGLGAKKVYLLHDDTEFQSLVAARTGGFLEEAKVAVRSQTGREDGWVDDVRSWSPDVLYLIYSEERLAAPMVRSLRSAVKDLPILLGRSLIRRSFFSALGEFANGLLLVDIFSRGAPRNEMEKRFGSMLTGQGVNLPTANHGFGWDAMTLCGRALAQANGEPKSAIDYLEAGVRLEGVTGSYRFSRNDHNGRSDFNPTVLSRVDGDKVSPCFTDP
ncbi:MAG: ABC transporter substrate-binding protein [Deltaproteobacteria bacterium]|nr:ABC transporter substrate-binding protein [Deltaproteobacteria bacterium]